MLAEDPAPDKAPFEMWRRPEIELLVLMLGTAPFLATFFWSFHQAKYFMEKER